MNAAGSEFLSRHLRARRAASGLRTVDLRHWQLNIELVDPAAVVLERPLGIFVHLFYDGLADEIASYIAAIDLPKKIYVSTNSEAKRKWIERIFDQYDLCACAEIAIVPNWGTDIGPLLIHFAPRLQDHDICLKIHSKRSLHNSPEFGERWRSYLYNELMGEPARVGAIVHAMLANPSLGILMPRHWTPLHEWIGIGANYEPMKQLLARINVDLLPDQTVEYPSGSMFWFRSDAVAKLVRLHFEWRDFDRAVDTRDATLAHAVERCILFFCAGAGCKWAFLPLSQPNQEIPYEEAMRIIRESGTFDNAYYLATYPDIKASSVDPLEHWVTCGAQEGRDPSATFSTRYYTRLMRRHTRSNVNPLVHYLLYGRALGLQPARPARVSATVKIDDLYAGYVRAEKGRDYVGEAKPIIRRSEIKLIAFYFPQFHPFPENSEFWGRGFTEWTNTTKAIPMFPGHYQPRLPGELGFYDTRVKDVLKRQIELAKQYGIHGFCLHHYFFSGKPVMRVPYDTLLANPDLEIPFCLHWANEPWTVRWDGLATKTGMLLDQRHEPQDDFAFFRDIEPAVRDPRYIKIDGRPLLVVYRPALFPDMAATIKRWRDCFRDAGLRDPYLAVMQNAFEGAVDPRKYGFDAAIEYPPHNLASADVTHRVEVYDPGFEGTVRDYEFTLGVALARPEPEYRLFRGIMPDWDCTPRRANPELFINAVPHRYQRWLEGLCAKTDADRPRDEKLIFINAWNEWAEAAYLEPDRKYGYAYLHATARALNSFQPCLLDRLHVRLLIGAHIFYADLLAEFADYFAKIPGRFDLLITTPTERRSEVSEFLHTHLSARAGSIRVVGVDNVGRDFAPFVFHYLPATLGYDLCCWTHSKKSPYESAYAGWRKYLLDNLLGSPQTISAIVEAFAREPKLGLVYPQAFPAVARKVEWGSNFMLTQTLLGRLGITAREDEQPVFPTAAMFWFRPAALQRLLKLGLSRDDFLRYSDGPRDPVSGAIVDGTISHAFERMILYVTRSAGYDFREVLFEP
ncbi:MAG: glycoside hydrolase family 99-like domain-containing protein [Steroidobacteraceae bacterium]